MWMERSRMVHNRQMQTTVTRWRRRYPLVLCHRWPSQRKGSSSIVWWVVLDLLQSWSPTLCESINSNTQQLIRMCVPSARSSSPILGSWSNWSYGVRGDGKLIGKIRNILKWGRMICVRTEGREGWLRWMPWGAEGDVQAIENPFTLQ